MQEKKLRIPRKKISEFCRRWAVVEFSLFGSALRPDFRPDSDVDVLVEFAPNAHIGWEIIQIQDELAALFGGRAIDLVTYKALNPHIRPQVLASAVTLYEQR